MSKENKEVAAAPQMTLADYRAVARKWLQTFTGAELTAAEADQFLEICAACGLNPFKREIHVSAYGQGEYRKLSIITGYEVYLKRAESTGQLNGWKWWVEGEKENMTAHVEIWRKDWDKPFEHSVLYREAVQVKKDGSPNSVWAKQPTFMLRKTAAAQAFRLCFPGELGGMPYEESEVTEYEPPPEKNVTPEKTPPQPPQGAAKAQGTPGTEKTTPPTAQAPIAPVNTEAKALFDAQAEAWRLAHGTKRYEDWYKYAESNGGTIETYRGIVKKIREALDGDAANITPEMAAFEERGAPAAPLNDGEIPFEEAIF